MGWGETENGHSYIADMNINWYNFSRGQFAWSHLGSDKNIFFKVHKALYTWISVTLLITIKKDLNTQQYELD